MKFVKKLTALFLAIVMTMAMGITVFADDVDTNKQVKLSISEAVEGHSYKVYQLLTGDVSELNQTEKDGATGKLANTEIGSSVDTTKAANADAVIAALKDGESWKSASALGDAAYGLIDKSKPVDTLGTTKTTTTVAQGYYIIVDEYSENIKGENVVYSRNMVTVVGDTTIVPKTETPKIDKNIIDNTKDGKADPNKALDYVADKGGKTDTAAIGDTIEFEVTGTVPNMEGYTYYYYVLNDTLSKGLTLDKTSFKVKVGDKDLTADQFTLYVTSEGEGQETKFKLGIVDLKTMDGISTGNKISIKYNATVNSYALIGDGQNVNKNEASLIYSNNPNDSSKHDTTGKPGIPDDSKPTGETPKVETKTYVTSIKVLKVDNKGNALTGAEFQLTGDNLNQIKFETGIKYEKADDGTYYLLKNGSYTTEAPTLVDVKGEDGQVTKKANADLYQSTTDKYKKVTYTTTTSTTVDAANVKMFVGEDGTVTFVGLNAGTYTLKETTTPVGYNTIEDIIFEVKGNDSEVAEGKDFEWTLTDTSKTAGVSLKDGVYEIKVVNNPGSTLPSTGGMGTAVIYVAGIAMIVAAGVVVIVRKRFA